jgi:hypothetical protein
MLMAFLAAGCQVKFIPIQVVRSHRRSRIRPLADTVRWWKWWRGLGRPLTHPVEIENRRHGNPECEFKQAFTR